MVGTQSIWGQLLTECSRRQSGNAQSHCKTVMNNEKIWQLCSHEFFSMTPKSEYFDGWITSTISGKLLLLKLWDKTPLYVLLLYLFSHIVMSELAERFIASDLYKILGLNLQHINDSSPKFYMDQKVLIWWWLQSWWPLFQAATKIFFSLQK